MEDLPEHIRAGDIPPARVYLDGVEMTDVLEVHTGEGWVIMFTRDSKGGVVRNGEHILTETRRGTVTVELIGGQVNTETEAGTR